ncbi:MAG: SIMPL domain-containing protein [Patescibacteria group bacterium]
MENSNKSVVFGLILGLSIIIAAAVVGRTFFAVKNLDNVISVSGSAKQTVTADQARWTGNFSRTAFRDNIKGGYSQMKIDEKKVSDFLDAQGFKGKYEISPVFMHEIYKNDANAPKEYNLTQNIEIKSDDVNKMKELAKNSDQIAAKDIIFSANSVEYYYSKLPELRVSLLPNAIKDAKARATAIAESDGRSLDTVRGVNMGVVQVMPVGSIEISDYGSYDTSSIDKEVMVTVKATFGVK